METSKNEKLKRKIFFLEKAVFFIMTVVLVFAYTKTLYSVDMSMEASRSAGISPSELFFVMGVITGVWCLWAFLVVVFVEWKEVDKNGKTDNREQLCVETLHQGK